MAYLIVAITFCIALAAGWIANRIEHYFKQSHKLKAPKKDHNSPAISSTSLPQDGERPPSEPRPQIERKEEPSRGTTYDSPQLHKQCQRPTSGLAFPLVDLKPRQPTVVVDKDAQPSPTLCLIDPEFDDWKGDAENKYPPDWEIRKLARRNRDGRHCQIVGCPSIEKLHVHHITAIKDGGNHALDNLITLCEFHHALMPEHLEPLAKTIDSSRYTIVTGFWRNNPGGFGSHYVEPFIRRLQCADGLSVAKLMRERSLVCPVCRSPSLMTDERTEPALWIRNSCGDEFDWFLRLGCQSCRWVWYSERKLIEEIGLQLGRLVSLTAHPRMKPFEDKWLAKISPLVDCPACPVSRCGGHLVWRTNPEDHSVFRGCSNYRLTKCPGR